MQTAVLSTSDGHSQLHQSRFNCLAGILLHSSLVALQVQVESGQRPPQDLGQTPLISNENFLVDTRGEQRHELAESCLFVVIAVLRVESCLQVACDLAQLEELAVVLPV